MRWISTCLSLVLTACTIDGHAIVAGDETSGDASSSGEPNDSGDATEETGETELGDESDLPSDPEPFPALSCSLAPDALNGLLPCELPPPSAAIAPVVAWTWTGPGGEDSVLATPLVANLDDDNGDGFVDVCDTPDVVLAVVDLPSGKQDPWPSGHLHIIDGGGAAARMLGTPIDASINPALGDLDGDGVAEIVALQAQGPNSPYQLSQRRLLAFHADGELLWAGPHWQESRGGGAIAITDLDGDGEPEVLAPEYVADANGELRWAPDDPALAFSMPVAVDLDRDGQLEVLFGGTAYTHDGIKLFDTPNVPPNRGSVGVANFDDDPEPELYFQYAGSHGVIEHDGSLKAECPAGTVEMPGAGGYPVAIEDLDGDDRAELLFGYHDQLYVLGIEGDACVVRWSKKVDAIDGLSSGTAFDLLGDGTAEAIHADRSHVRLYADDGELLFQIQHTARESIANPIVVDVDGDGAAEILIVSSEPSQPSKPSMQTEPLTSGPSLVVLENGDDRFAPTRRVWNQHTYHHRDVSELGRIPAPAVSSASVDDGFRVNHRMLLGEQCIPPWLAP
jgi:hypothetical protein